MSNIYRTLGIIIVLLYLVGVLIAGYFSVSDAKMMTLLFDEVPLITYFFLGTTLLAVLGFIFLYLGASNRIDVVYVNQGDSKLNDKFNFNHQNTDAVSAIKTTSQAVLTVEQLIRDNQADRKLLLDKFLRNICQHLEASVGALYLLKTTDEDRLIELAAGYAVYRSDNHNPVYRLGEGLVGQVAKNGKPIKLDTIPEGYIEIVSGLGGTSPTNLMFLPILSPENEICGVIELASFKKFTENDLSYLQEVALLLAKELEADEYYSLN
jgi:hypothetical protein